MSSSDEELGQILNTAALLVDSSLQKSHTDLRNVLTSRLVDYHALLNQEYVQVDQSLDGVKLDTALRALDVAERLHSLLIARQLCDASACDEPLLGVRDLQRIRSMLSVILRWGVDALLTTERRSEPSKDNDNPSNSLIAHSHLLSIASRLTALLVSDVDGRMEASPTIVASTLLEYHTCDLLKLYLVLGWPPDLSASESTPTADRNQLVMATVLRTLPSSHAMTALGSMLWIEPPLSPHLKRICSGLLERQRLRRDGVVGLCISIFGEGDDRYADIALTRLESFADMICRVPRGMDKLRYFKGTVAQLIAILSQAANPAHIRAAAFAISRLIASEKTFPHRGIVWSVLRPIFHSPLLETSPESLQNALSSSSTSADSARLTPNASLSILQLLIANMEPSPMILSSVLGPIVTALYTLWYTLENVRTADPVVRETVGSLLMTWARVVSENRAVDTLMEIVSGKGGEWEVAIGGEIKKLRPSAATSLSSSLTPTDLLQFAGREEPEVGETMLKLRPEPSHLARFVESMNRPDIRESFLARLLQEFQRLGCRPDSDPMRAVLLLGIITRLGAHPSHALTRPSVIVAFTKQVLSNLSIAKRPELPKASPAGESRGLSLKDLHIVPDGARKDSDSDVEDSDDEPEDNDDEPEDGSETHVAHGAVRLLHAVLAADTNLSPRTLPELEGLDSLLDLLANSDPAPLRRIARETRMILTARTLSQPFIPPAKKRLAENAPESPQETYQKALKLLQDPILPVRAHGLLLLRQLVQSRALDPALVPGILSIFLQSLEDDDSYVFLNAVQGLAAMVDSFGRGTLTGLIKLYAGGLDGIDSTHLTQREIDKRLRLGEALGQVVRKCGDALPVYADVLIPPLWFMVRATHISNTLRTSALSLLADIAKTSPISIVRYAGDCIEGMIDLLQVESVPSSSSSQQQEEDQQGPILDDPTLTDSKLPPLRRAAIHLLTLVFRSLADCVRDDPESLRRTLHRGVVSRARITLAYVASTDRDPFVRVKAREATQILEDLGRMILGF